MPDCSGADVVRVLRRLARGLQKALQLRIQLAAAVKAARSHRRQSGARSIQLRGASHAKKCAQIDQVLWPTHVVARKNLQRDEVANLSHAHAQPRKQFQHFALSNDLAFDAGGCEKQVYDGRVALLSEGQSNRGRRPTDSCSMTASIRNPAERRL